MFNSDDKIMLVGVARDEETNKMFRCVMYSNHLEEPHMIERVITKDEELDKILVTLAQKGFRNEVMYKQMKPADWDAKKAEFIDQIKALLAEKEKEQAEISKAYNDKIAATEKKANVKNLKVWGITALTIAALAVGGYALHKNNNNSIATPNLASPTPTAYTTNLPGKTVDERITAMKDQFAKGEMNYDITNPNEVEKRVNILIGYFDKMQKGVINKSEATDFYLLLNGIMPSNGVDIDELMRKIQSAAAYDPYFDWREVAGQEIVANKRDSAYLDIYLKAINDWKAAAESHDMKQVGAMGKELVATSYYGVILREPLNTSVQEIGQVKMENVSDELKAFITGYVAMTLNYPGYDIYEAIGPITIKGDSINVNHLAEPLAGRHVIPTGEKGATDKGGEMGLAQSTMTMIVTKYHNGEYPECPEEIKAKLDTLSKQSVKTLK